ncbi:hypothetical protein [Methylobacterium sp. Leaf117]|uniref:hypothetical protein n=1 Tax=Methylobacterium sp. Leaf117 TaxID=1736260 RepID=UPI0006FF5E9F|nr:hypothetical protein [Methylobacterium sp. Leaf117]KQP96714.1 hypothetical protein ASF57_03020 [Methylobacterium sp. Leaf117]
MQRISGRCLILGLVAGLLTAQTAQAQYYDDGYDQPPPRRYEERRLPPRPYDRDDRYERRAPRREVGLNCDAVQSGFTGYQPYSCPLPGPRPLGARCFCNMPIAPLSAPQTAVGRVVP